MKKRNRPLPNWVKRKSFDCVWWAWHAMIAIVIHKLFQILINESRWRSSGDIFHSNWPDIDRNAPCNRRGVCIDDSKCSDTSASLSCIESSPNIQLPNHSEHFKRNSTLPLIILKPMSHVTFQLAPTVPMGPRMLRMLPESFKYFKNGNKNLQESWKTGRNLKKIRLKKLNDLKNLKSPQRVSKMLFAM